MDLNTTIKYLKGRYCFVAAIPNIDKKYIQHWINELKIHSFNLIQCTIHPNIFKYNNCKFGFLNRLGKV